MATPQPATPQPPAQLGGPDQEAAKAAANGQVPMPPSTNLQQPGQSPPPQQGQPGSQQQQQLQMARSQQMQLNMNQMGPNPGYGAPMNPVPGRMNMAHQPGFVAPPQQNAYQRPGRPGQPGPGPNSAPLHAQAWGAVMQLADTLKNIAAAGQREPLMPETMKDFIMTSTRMTEKANELYSYYISEGRINPAMMVDPTNGLGGVPDPNMIRPGMVGGPKMDDGLGRGPPQGMHPNQMTLQLPPGIDPSLTHGVGGPQMSRLQFTETKPNALQMNWRMQSSTRKVCHICGTSETPKWRKLPGSQFNLCNACGLYYASRETKKRKKGEVTEELAEAVAANTNMGTMSARSDDLERRKRRRELIDTAVAQAKVQKTKDNE
eukprot:GFYU01004653.1.p1 GENE.GFYU01004653.1~~GFYU01004653.1.p1  ORF type:complete len:376 (-),score=83.54 GFYU01004653.1:81-1208(-)